jgi:low affinity Fe/Cu permease
LTHPADRTERGSRGRFEVLAERASFLVSSPVFFFACLGVVMAWGGGVVIGASDRYLTAAAGGMSAMTLIIVALLKNAELRAERAIQRKLDAIATSLLEDKRARADRSADAGRERSAERELERAIRMHEEI